MILSVDILDCFIAYLMINSTVHKWPIKNVWGKSLFN